MTPPEDGQGRQCASVHHLMSIAPTNAGTRADALRLQAAMAHDIMMSGMPLEALVEVYDVPSEGGGRPPQCAPVVRTLLRRAIPATSGGVGVGGGGGSFLSPLAGAGGVEETGEVSGNISFLPSLYHGVTAEIAFSEVERICSVCLGGGFLAAKNLVFDCIILTASCFAALRYQQIHKWMNPRVHLAQ